MIKSAQGAIFSVGFRVVCTGVVRAAGCQVHELDGGILHPPEHPSQRASRILKMPLGP